MRRYDMDLKELIKPELLILIPVLYVVGIGLKKSKLSDTLIPLILGGIAIVLSSAWVIATSDISTLFVPCICSCLVMNNVLPDNTPFPA